MMASRDSAAKSDGKADKTLVVAAIDFGTCFTGFAFAFRNNTDEVFTSKWIGLNVMSYTEKAPTSVLLSPEKQFIAFGYDAEEQYKLLIEKDRQHKPKEGNSTAKDYYYFKWFKMKLYETKKLRLDTKLADIHGKELPALDVFEVVIRHLKTKVCTDLVNTITGFQDDDITWIITVPAIWSDSAKQFMREAAKKAGLEGVVKLILEPEAASLYCNNKKLCKTTKLGDSVQVEPFPVGQKYIVADLGGGTADLSVHEILPDRNLREIHRADGDALGGIMVDHEFFDFLEQILGANVMKTMKERHMDLMFEIYQFFEIKKRKFDPNSPVAITIQIPATDIEVVITELNEDTLEEKITKASKAHDNQIDLIGNKLSIAPDIMKTFFRKVVDGIVDFVNKMREDDTLGEINALLMVGGFSESTYVQESIKRHIQGVRVIVPPNPSLAVLKGAVIAGCNPKAITERIARYTYGFSFAKEFVPGTDPENLKIIRHGKELCKSVFTKLITKGEVLKVGDHFGVPCAHLPNSDDLLGILGRFMPLIADVYRSEEKNPKYSEEEYGCELVGFMLIPPPLFGWPGFSLLIQELVVGEAEFTVRAVNINTLEVVEGKLDFLSSKQMIEWK